MATFNEKRDAWEWTAQEKSDRQRVLRRILATLKKIAEQVSQVNEFLPEFSERAIAALDVCSKGLEPLTKIDLRRQGRKYQSVSPEQMDDILVRLPELMKGWIQLTSSPEYVQAVRAANREMRHHNLEVREQNRQAIERLAVAFQKVDGRL